MNTRSDQVDAFAEERRAAGFKAEESEYMRTAGRSGLTVPGRTDDGGGPEDPDDVDTGDDLGDLEDGAGGDGDEGQDDGSDGDQRADGQQQQRQQREPENQNPIPYQKYRRDIKRLRERLTARDNEYNMQGNQLRQLNERFARLDERLRVFQEAAEAGDPEQQENQGPPNPDEDPIGAVKWVLSQLPHLAQNQEQVQRRVQRRDDMDTLHQSYVNDARQFIQVQPAFREAYQWMVQLRDAQLRAAYNGSLDNFRMPTGS